MYDYTYKFDDEKAELCQYCQFANVCNKKNKTLAPMLTACACNIVLLQRAATTLEQKDGKIVEKVDEMLFSKNRVYATLLLKRLFQANVVCDTPHCNDELRRAVKQWLGKWYGKKYEEELDRLPNEKPQLSQVKLPNATHEQLDELRKDTELFT